MDTARQVYDLSSISTLVFENMAEGVCTYDDRGYIVFTNPAEDRMFGYERGELIGRHLTTQTAYPPEENEIFFSRLIQSLKTDGSWIGELLNRHNSGTSFYTSARFSAVELNGT